MEPFNIEPPSETKIEAVPKSITPEIDEFVGFSDCLNATTTGHIGYFAGNPAHSSISITPEMVKSAFRGNASVMYTCSVTGEL